jgi:replicative DNA helicase
MDNSAYDEVGAILRPSDFYVAGHAGIYSAICALIAANRPADVVTVFERTQDDIQYLNDLAASVATARSARAYAETVREHAVRREVMRLARLLGTDALQAHGGRPVFELIDQAVGALMLLNEQAVRREPTDMPHNITTFLDDLQSRADGNEVTFRTGLRDLDKLSAGGGRRGELWVMGARPSMGKTAFMLQLCRHVGQAHQVLLLSQEDSVLSAMARFVAAAGGVNLADIRSPQGAPDAMWQGVTDGIEQLAPLHVAIDEQTGLTLADVRRKGQQVRRRHRRLDLIVVDYLQLMDDGAGENRSQGLGVIANGLKRLSKELQCWVVLLSQLNRKADERNGPPQMGDLRDSGDIEGAADTIGLLYREHMRKPTEENKHWAQMHVCKQKNGPTDTLNLYFDGALQRFSDWDGPPPFKSAASKGRAS